MGQQCLRFIPAPPSLASFTFIGSRLRPGNEHPSDHRHRGSAARRTALRMLDACLRTGQPLDQAASAMAKGLEPSDRALAIAIAQEVLRWLPDLDLLIDSQTRLPLADDAKARMVLRMALAQMWPAGHATACRNCHCLAAARQGAEAAGAWGIGSLRWLQPTLPDAPGLTHPVADRWKAAWGAPMVGAVRVALAEPPLLDLTLADPLQTAKWVEELEGTSLAPGHVRLARGSAIEMLPGYADGAWWVQDLAASLPGRLLGPGTAGRSRTCAPHRAARRCNWRARAGTSPRSTNQPSGWTGWQPIWSAPGWRRRRASAMC